MYASVFQTGLPIATGPSGIGPPGAIWAATQPTVASVGPYSLVIVGRGPGDRQAANASPANASPPITRSAVGDKSPSTSDSWAGVTFTNAGRPSAGPAGSSSPARRTEP